MKKMIFAVLAIIITLPAATTASAQYDDDIYYSKSNAKKAIYKETESDTWSTDANNDWNIDDYNRRTDYTSASTSSSGGSGSLPESTSSSYSFEYPAGTYTETGSDPTVIRDTVYIVEQYYYSDRIRRFHNPHFCYYRYSPFYDVAFYDPFFWDYCYYDPWWWVTPSFGFHYGNWYLGWNPGYYCGWYGGWYAPYYHPHPHYFHPSYAHHYKPLPNRGHRINNFGGNFRHTHHLAHRSGAGATNRRGQTSASPHKATPIRTAQHVGRGNSNFRSTTRATVPSNRNTQLATTSNRGTNLRQPAGSTQRPNNAVTGNRSTENRRQTVSSGNVRRPINQVTSGSTAANKNQVSSSKRPTQVRDNSAARRNDNGVRQSSTGRSTVRQTATQSRSVTHENQSSQIRYNNSNTRSTTPSVSRSSSGSTSRSSGFSGGSSRGGSSGSSREGGGRR